jgi:xanthine dehydrogenase molybdenum-binding subunit
VLDETSSPPALSHHSMEPRSAIAYWENGKCYVHGSTQSQSFTAARRSPPDRHRARTTWSSSPSTCGGGFGSKGGAYPLHGDSGAHVAKKVAAPGDDAHQPRRGVLPRLCAAGFQGRIRMGFLPTGASPRSTSTSCRRTAPTRAFRTGREAGDAVIDRLPAAAMRWRGISVRPTRRRVGAARSRPEPDRRARSSRCSTRPLASWARSGSRSGASTRRRASRVTAGTRAPSRALPARSARYRCRAVRLGRAARPQRPAQRLQGDAGVAVGTGVPLGRLQRLRRARAHHARRRAAHPHRASAISAPTRTPAPRASRPRCSATTGSAARSSAATRARPALEQRPVREQHLVHDVAHQLRRGDGRVTKLKEIAARRLGGSPADYDVANETVFRRSSPSSRLSYAQAARIAIELGGRYSGHEPPDDINPMTEHRSRSSPAPG